MRPDERADNMRHFCTILGVFMCALIILAVPVITVLSFVYHWHWLISTLSIMVTLGDYILVVFTTAYLVEYWDN